MRVPTASFEPSASSEPRVRARSSRSRALRTAVLAVAVALTAGVFTAPASWSALPVPQAPVTMPPTAEALQPYVPQRSCDPRIKPGVRKFRDLMLATYPQGHDGGSTRACTAGGTSEHYEGRAWDWMLDSRKKAEDRVARSAIAWLMKAGPDGEPALQARRLGVMYVIYDGRIWGVWSGRWRALSPSSDQHTNHIHVSFSWAGAMGRTSFWTGRVGAVDYGPCARYRNQPAVIYRRANPTPCATDLPRPPRTKRALAWTGSTGPMVLRAQGLLKMPAEARTGTFGTRTRKAVRAYQRAKGLPRTGALDQPTWYALDPSSRVAPAPDQPAPPTPVPTPTPTPTTPTSTSSPTTSTGDGSASLPPASSWKPLSVGMSGPRVLAVQKALRLAADNRTGYFGSVTLAAVKEFQRRKGLEVDGVVGPRTAKALGLVA